MDSNSGTDTVSKDINVTKDVHDSTAALKVPRLSIKYQDAKNKPGPFKYKVDLCFDPIQTMKRCTSRSTSSVDIPQDYVRRISQINYGRFRLRPCAYWNVNKCVLPSPHPHHHPESEPSIKFYHTCKVYHTSLGAALFHTLLDCPLAEIIG